MHDVGHEGSWGGRDKHHIDVEYLDFIFDCVALSMGKPHKQRSHQKRALAEPITKVSADWLPVPLKTPAPH